MSILRDGRLGAAHRPNAACGRRTGAASWSTAGAAGPVVLLSVLAVGAGPGADGPPQEFRLGPIRVAPGEAASGYLAVPDGADPGTSIPITIAHGTRQGPVLALIAGIHGSEYAPILAVQRLRKDLDAKKLAGTVILVHVANPPSFLKRTIYYGADGKNLNRVFPGKADGTITERIAHVLTRDVIERADVVIDIHSGDNNESLAPYVGYVADSADPSVSQRSLELALAFGFEYIIRSRDRPKDPMAAVYCSNAALTRGKPAIAVESGELGRPEPEAVERIVRGATGAMSHLRMIDVPRAKSAQPRFVDRSEVLKSPVTGLFEPLVECGANVAAGTPLGRVTDFFGVVTHEAKAPFDGVVFYILGTPPVSADEPLAMIGRLEEDRP